MIAQCPQCNAVAAPASNFCEECGAPLRAPLAPAVARLELCDRCGAAAEEIDDAGFCSRCGIQRRRPERDHFEITPSPLLAGVSDRGIKHFRNEDYIAAHETPHFYVAALCDGVSSSRSADAASAAGAQAFVASLAEALKDGAMKPAYFQAAVTSANEAILRVAREESILHDPPESTLVAAVAPKTGDRRLVHLAWLGDSRAYFISSDAARVLTKDHSWLVEVVESGMLDYESAVKCRGARAITRTLGGDLEGLGVPADEPSVLEVELPGPGWLLLCSDGLWNYAPELSDLAALVRTGSPEAPLDLARRLVAWARDRGGRDNVSVLALAI